MQDKETNKRNERGVCYGLWGYRWENGNMVNTFNYINGRMFGHIAHYGMKGEIITASYYAK